MLRPEGLSRITTDAIGIWRAGVDAVRADRVVEREVQGNGRSLIVQGQEWKIHPHGRLIVVGAGKATYKMAEGLLAALKDLDPKVDRVGWINVPEGTVAGPLEPWLHACEARPMGANEPTSKVVVGTQRIVDLVATTKPEDTVICLLSGGGSALLCSPIDGITLEDKLAVTRFLSSHGATIEQLNLVRSALSRVKHGGLARLCGAGRIITLLLSDVLGDSLSTIASGPTFLEFPINFDDAARTLKAFDQDFKAIPANVYRSLIDQAMVQAADKPMAQRHYPSVVNLVLANNATAVDAAGTEAVRRGYAYYMESSPRSEGHAEDLGRALANQCLGLAVHPEIQCLITGGEPSVVLPTIQKPGKGGRNQHLVLAALDELQRQGVQPERLAKMVILSGGTDGEDGPTDAAGAWLDASIAQKSINLNLKVGDYLAKCDSYNFFAQTNSLLKTGPTHTNVCDIRVAIFDSRNLP